MKKRSEMMVCGLKMTHLAHYLNTLVFHTICRGILHEGYKRFRMNSCTSSEVTLLMGLVHDSITKESDVTLQTSSPPPSRPSKINPALDSPSSPISQIPLILIVDSRMWMAVRVRLGPSLGRRVGGRAALPKMPTDPPAFLALNVGANNVT